MEEGEIRTDSGTGFRIVRIGTHALKAGSKTSLWNRLSQHKGQEKSGGGNHRGSIFRLILGTALDKEQACPTWGRGNNAHRHVRDLEIPMERKVSQVIRAMPLLWLSINDDAGAASLRGYIERNAIALLSNAGKDALDPSSVTWIGHDCTRDRVKASGLWNQNHVDESYDPEFLSALERSIEEMGTA